MWNPPPAQTYGRIPRSELNDVEAAVTAATSRLSRMAGLESRPNRRAVMMRLADKSAENADMLCRS